MRKIYIIGALACLVSACKPSVNITTPATSGSAIFTNYMAIGSAHTAGYADSSLYVTGQLNSYPQRLFEQFSLIPDRGARGIFYQPLLHGDMGYPTARFVVGMKYNECIPADSSLGPVDLPTFSYDAQDAARYVSPGPNGQINNIATPYCRVGDLTVANFGIVNPYAARFFVNTIGTPIDELRFRVDNLHPTFFTMWLGIDDVLGYALAGGQGNGTGNALPGALNFYNSNDIIPSPVFYSNYDSAVGIAISTGSKGALVSVPDVTTFPFFTTIPANGLTIPRQSLADSLNAYYATLNLVFKLGSNYFIIQDNAGNVRQAVPGELILLSTPQDSLTCAAWGSFKPILKQYVLTTDEIQNIRNATTRYNSHIQGVAARNNLAYVDMLSFMSQISTGITFNGINYSTQYIAGGAFSLDGVHFTPRGYALVANRIIQAINAQYGSTVNTIDVNQYHGILFP